jgi:murein DD-endopeptidase MepM/ murein hydrolase activator NlpD
VLVGTALSASLITGVTIGTAAATASARGAESARTTAVTRPLNPGADDDFGSGDELMPGNAPATSLVAVGAPNADAVRQKSRVLVTATTSAETTAAWVNPNPTAVVTSCFGERWGRLHAGVDLAAPDGTPIVAAGAGVVVRAGVAEGYGNAVLIDHGNGYLTHYGHLSKITVAVGQHVAAGQQIGNEGSTGHSTGPHLHFEVHQSFYQNPIEPTEWMHQHGVDIPGCVPLV